MGQHIVKQPNGKYAIFSSKRAHFIAYDATPEEIRELRRAEAIEESDRFTKRGMDRAEAGHGFTGMDIGDRMALGLLFELQQRKGAVVSRTIQHFIEAHCTELPPYWGERGVTNPPHSGAGKEE